MYWKLLIFSLAFCLGLLFARIPQPIECFNSPDSPNVSEANPVLPINENNEGLFASSNSQTIEKQRNRFEVAGVENDDEVKNFYLKFQKAVAENNRKTVASIMIYPLRVSFPNDKPTANYTLIKDINTFLKVYDRIFDDRFKNFIAKIDVEKIGKYPEPDDIWARYDGIAVGRGVIWIGVYCSRRNCENNKHYIKIRTLHADSNLMDY